MERKVALLTMFDVLNYGSVLQAYASQIVMERLGYGCDLINYAFPNEWHYKRGYGRSPFPRRIVGSIMRMLNIKTPGMRKVDSFNLFKKEHLHLTQRFSSPDSLKKYDWGTYDTIIAGSDQVWNPRFMKGDTAFLLDFAPDSIRKISFASSFACNEIGKEYHSDYNRLLSRFSSLSVRDRNGVEVMRSLGIERDAKIMLDPTLLVGKEDWLEKLDIPASGNKEKDYILVYMLDYAFNPTPYIYDVARELQKKYQCGIVFIGNIKEEDVKGFKDHSIANESNIGDFVSLFANARGVVTSSFHGTAFAVNFGKPLIAIVPDNGDDRQSSLLKKLGIERCSLKVNSKVLSPVPEYDVADVTHKLAEIRRDNLEWLSKALIRD